VRGDTLPEKWP